MVDNNAKCPCCEQNIEIDEGVLNDLQLQKWRRFLL